ncbi:FadR/GntR family transcriptional regulator [Blastococcus sp. SYSU DS0616]
MSAEPHPRAPLQVTPPKAAEIIAADLRARIIGERLPPGSSLPSETELMDIYSFSRASIREALRLLESDGLIYIKRGARGGVRVARPSMSQLSRSFAVLFATEGTPLRDLIRFRQLLEPAAAATAAVRADHEQQERLMEATERLGTHATSGADLEFHRILISCSDNHLLRTSLLAVQQLSDWHIPAEQLSAQDLHGARTAHRRLALAVVRRDAEEASRLMTVHLHAFEKVLHRLGRLDEPILPVSRWNSVVTEMESGAQVPDGHVG